MVPEESSRVVERDVVCVIQSLPRSTPSANIVRVSEWANMHTVDVKVGVVGM